MNYKRRDIKLAKDFALFALKNRFQWDVDRSWNEFAIQNTKSINKSWEIVSFQIGRFTLINGITTDRKTEEHTKWDVVYKNDGKFKLGCDSEAYCPVFYDYNKMIERPDTYKILQVKIVNQLYNIGDIYPKFKGVYSSKSLNKIKSFFIQKGDLYIETHHNGKILVK